MDNLRKQIRQDLESQFRHAYKIGISLISTYYTLLIPYYLWVYTNPIRTVVVLVTASVIMLLLVCLAVLNSQRLPLGNNYVIAMTGMFLITLPSLLQLALTGNQCHHLGVALAVVTNALVVHRRDFLIAFQALMTSLWVAVLFYLHPQGGRVEYFLGVSSAIIVAMATHLVLHTILTNQEDLRLRDLLREQEKDHLRSEMEIIEEALKVKEAETINAMVRLAETVGEAGEDLRHWVGDMAQEVARALGADQIHIWEAVDGNYCPLTETEALQAPFPTEQPDLLQILGPDGRAYAVLKVKGKGSVWTALERNLLNSFVHHLGSALHFKVFQKMLTESQQNLSLNRQALSAQGSGVLMLCPACKRCFDENSGSCPDDGAALITPRLLPYRFQGRYRLEKLLGEGGTAHVFEAWDEKLARSVALKAIKPNNFTSAQSRQRFAREASVLARLDHPGIVTVHDSRELEDGTLFLVMERLVGMTVGQLLSQWGPARPGQAAFLLRQVSSALASTHAKGLVHRDMKPDNLFAMAGGDWIRYKVLDFGLAKTEFTEVGNTQTGALMGTPAYMSPEQARGQEVDWRSDMYSLATILYEILTGVPVIRSSMLGDILLEVISEQPAPLSTWAPDCPSEVEALITRALAKDPHQRPIDLLAWTGRLDTAMQSWDRDISGWPDRITKSASGDSPGGSPVHAEAHPTLMKIEP